MKKVLSKFIIVLPTMRMITTFAYTVACFELKFFIFRAFLELELANKLYNDDFILD